MCVPSRTTNDAIEVGANLVLATLKMSHNGGISSLVSMVTGGYYKLSHRKSEVKLSCWPISYLVYSISYPLIVRRMGHCFMLFIRKTKLFYFSVIVKVGTA